MKILCSYVRLSFKRFCSARPRGWRPEGEVIRVGSRPVQFIPAFDPVTKEAKRLADVGEIGDVPLRVVRADYVAIIALSVGRAEIHKKSAIHSVISATLPSTAHFVFFPASAETGIIPANLL